MHNFIFKILYHSKLLKISGVIYHLFLNNNVLIIIIIMDLNRDLVSIIIQIDETIIQKESTIAFLSIAIINLFTSLNIIHCFNNETFFLISIGPCSLSRSFMIEHISICYKTISFYTFDLDTKYSAWYHHSYFRIFLKWELCKLRNFFTY